MVIACKCVPERRVIVSYPPAPRPVHPPRPPSTTPPVTDPSRHSRSVSKINSICLDGVEALRDSTNKPPRVTACGHHLCGDCAELWFATETKCPVCSARCVGIPDGLREIEAPARKDDDDEREEEQEKEEAPAVREEAVRAAPVEDDLVLEEDDLAPNEDPAADDAGSDAETRPPAPPDASPPGESPPGESPPGGESPPAVDPTDDNVPTIVVEEGPGGPARTGPAAALPPGESPPGESPTVDNLLEQLSSRWRFTSAENARLRSDVDRLEEECGYLREALRAARAENDALRAGGTTNAPKHVKSLEPPRMIEPAADPDPQPSSSPRDPRLAAASSRVEDAVAGLWRSRGGPRAPKPPAVTVNVHDSQTSRPIHAAAIRPAPANATRREDASSSSFVCVTASWDGVAKVHAVTRAHGGRTATIRTASTCRGHSTGLYACEFSSLAFGGLLGTVSGDGTCRLWQDRDGNLTYECVGVLEGHRDEVNGLAFAPNAPLLATASDDGTAVVWDLNGGTYVPVAHCSGHGAEVYGVGWSADNVLATVSFDRTCKLWDVRCDTRGNRESNGINREWERDSKSGGAVCARTLTGHGDDVVGVCFHPRDSRVLATGSDDGTVRVWDTRGTCDGGVVTTLTLHGGKETKRIAFSPNGAMLAAGGADGTCAVVDASTWERIATLAGHTDTVFDVAWSPDAKSIVTASHDASWRVWSV